MVTCGVFSNLPLEKENNTNSNLGLCGALLSILDNCNKTIKVIFIEVVLLAIVRLSVKFGLAKSGAVFEISLLFNSI